MASELYDLRSLVAIDNPKVAHLIRTVMPEFGAAGPGFALHDTEVDDMFTAYTQPRTAYFVVVRGEAILGGGGIAPLAGGDADTCELRKMYFLRELRGQGYGQKLLDRCLAFARKAGFGQCYLETLKTMSQARGLYAKNAFKPLKAPMGGTGHFGCDAWYVRQL